MSFLKIPLICAHCGKILKENWFWKKHKPTNHQCEEKKIGFGTVIKDLYEQEKEHERGL